MPTTAGCRGGKAASDSRTPPQHGVSIASTLGCGGAKSASFLQGDARRVPRDRIIIFCDSDNTSLRARRPDTPRKFEQVGKMAPGGGYYSKAQERRTQIRT